MLLDLLLAPAGLPAPTDTPRPPCPSQGFLAENEGCGDANSGALTRLSACRPSSHVPALRGQSVGLGRLLPLSQKTPRQETQVHAGLWAG